MRWAMPRPIRPNPMNPTFISVPSPSCPSCPSCLLEAARALGLASEHGPVFVAVAMTDGSDQAIAHHAAARQRNAHELPGREREFDVLEAELHCESRLVVRRVDHQLAVDLVGG